MTYYSALRSTHCVQSLARTRHVTCGSNHSRFGELFVVRDVACDVTNHKLCRGNMALSMALSREESAG